jgi:hypothetical protein
MTAVVSKRLHREFVNELAGSEATARALGAGS